MVVHMPLFHIKTPGNVNSFNTYFAEIASFDMIDFKEVTDSLGYVPEMDAISLNFQMAGHKNNLVI